MNREELEKQFPELAAELKAVGAAEERARYDLHVGLGRQSGALAMALADYEAGTAVTGAVMSRHMDHSFRQRAIQDHQEDSDAAGAVLNNAARGGGQTGLSAIERSLERIAGGAT